MPTDPKLRAFLDLIAFSEGTSTHPLTKNDGYDVIVSGVDGAHIFSDYSDHPFAAGQPHIVIRRAPLLVSSAAGRYQLELKWWRIYRAQLGLKDFSPASQDAVALQQIRERKAIPMILAGHVDQAIAACSNIWASFPGNTYAQGGKSMETLLAKYSSLAGGQ